MSGVVSVKKPDFFFFMLLPDFALATVLRNGGAISETISTNGEVDTHTFIIIHAWFFLVPMERISLRHRPQLRLSSTGISWTRVSTP